VHSTKPVWYYFQAVHSTREHLVNDTAMTKLLVYYNSFINTLAAK